MPFTALSGPYSKSQKLVTSPGKPHSRPSGTRDDENTRAGAARRARTFFGATSSTESWAGGPDRHPRLLPRLEREHAEETLQLLVRPPSGKSRWEAGRDAGGSRAVL